MNNLDRDSICSLNGKGITFADLRYRDQDLSQRPAVLTPIDRRSNNGGILASVLRKDSYKSGRIAEGMILALHDFRTTFADGVCSIILTGQTDFLVTQPPEGDEKNAQHKDILSNWFASRLYLERSDIDECFAELTHLLVIAGGFLKIGEPTALEASVKAFIRRLNLDNCSYGDFMDRFKKYQGVVDNDKMDRTVEEMEADVDGIAIDVAAGEYISQRLKAMDHDDLEEDREVDYETDAMVEFQLTEKVRKDTQKKLSSVGIWFSTTLNPHTAYCDGEAIAQPELMTTLNQKLMPLIDLSQIFIGNPFEEEDEE